MVMLHIFLVMCPFMVICYHFYSWVQYGEVTAIPFSSFLYNWFGLDLTIKNVSADMQGFYMLYIFLLQLPLLFWFTVLAIPSAVKVYRMTNE